jgi:hypothetical protein
MRLLLFLLLIFLTEVVYSQALQFGAQAGYNSTHFDIKGTSYTDMRNERLWSFGYNYGVSVALLSSKGYYQRMQYGAKLEWNRSYHCQEISIYPQPYTFQSGNYWKGRYEAVFSDIALLYTHNPLHHQAVFLEIGPMFSTVIRRYNEVTHNSLPYEVEIEQTKYQYMFLSLMGRCGLYYNVNKRLAWSFAVQGGKNLTPVTVERNFGRFWGGFSFSLICKVKT